MRTQIVSSTTCHTLVSLVVVASGSLLRMPSLLPSHKLVFLFFLFNNSRFARACCTLHGRSKPPSFRSPRSEFDNDVLTKFGRWTLA
eukprot:scaffold417_cov252-Pinguiococcus_pyrenoidosus.AAC.13